MTNIALIDNNPLFSEQFARYFRDIDDIQVVYVATSLEQFALDLPKIPTFQSLFLDVDFSDADELEILSQFKAAFSDVNIIMLTEKEDSDSLFKAFCNGATGYILKTTPIENLQIYIEVLQKNGAAISAKMAQMLIEKAVIFQNKFGILNEKEYQILQLLAEGWSYKLIADKTDMSVDGVRFYIKRLYRALNVNSKGEAIHLFYKK
jgi:DNA-binding NarL/FixJ family response regulator